MATVPEEIQEIVEQLSPDYQRRVLEFVQGLIQTDKRFRSLPKSTPPSGTTGKALIGFQLSLEDVEAIGRAIMEDCE